MSAVPSPDMSAFDASHWDGPPWVFGYGSLIWRPGFEYIAAEQAFLRGAHRCLCIYSSRYRGTPEKPGLVFGLMPGGSCHGRAFQVDPKHWDQVQAYLWDRELLGGVYRPTIRRVRLETGQDVKALTFLAIKKHRSFAGTLALDEQIRIVRDGVGCRGPNLDYVLNTASHLEQMGISDPRLHRISVALEPFAKPREEAD